MSAATLHGPPVDADAAVPRLADHLTGRRADERAAEIVLALLTVGGAALAGVGW